MSRAPRCACDQDAAPRFTSDDARSRASQKVSAATDRQLTVIVAEELWLATFGDLGGPVSPAKRQDARATAWAAMMALQRRLSRQRDRST